MKIKGCFKLEGRGEGVRSTGGFLKTIVFRLVWFDSLGAKSSCTFIKTPDTSLVIDPGVAAMQPSFPASRKEKIQWKSKGASAIKQVCKQAEIIVITHYHYDHYFPEDMDVYRHKLVFAKNPNEYINDSQWSRALEFYGRISQVYGKMKLKPGEAEKKNYPDPMDSLPLAANKDFGDYNPRRKKLLELGLHWFENRVKQWNSRHRIPELKFKDIEIKWADGNQFELGKTKIRFTKPLFHGIEFSRVGWVTAIVVEHGQEKIIYSSDLNGVYIEDYAEWLVKENPDMLILDGPPTYMRFMLTKINLRRCIQNTCKILKHAKRLKLMIYDHHLLREKNYREKTKTVWETGEKKKLKVVTAAEQLGKTPLIDML